MTTPGATGELTVDEALMQLLRGTGLTYRHSGDNGISIVPVSPAKDANGGTERRGGLSGTDFARLRRITAGPSPRRVGWKRDRPVATPTRATLAAHSTRLCRKSSSRRSGAARTSSRCRSRPPPCAGSDLEGKGVTQLNDLQYASPSLSIGNAGLSNTVNIRGVGLASGSPAVANGVAVYVDGLFQTPTVYANQFYDIADVEILRGPQGTLVGANSTGGAIFINSRSPRLGEADGYVEVGGGSYDAWSAQGAVNLPVNDVLALRAGRRIHPARELLSQHRSRLHGCRLAVREGRSGSAFSSSRAPSRRSRSSSSSTAIPAATPSPPCPARSTRPSRRPIRSCWITTRPITSTASTS